jgi:predicted transcriptional regulator
MSHFKEIAIETIKSLPDDCSIEDIMYELYFIAQVMEGLKDVETERVINHEELLKKIKEWQR